MENIMLIAQSQYSALILCMVAIYFFWKDKKNSDKISHEANTRREERQERVNLLIQEEIKDGIQKSHEQHREIMSMCKDIDNSINQKSKLMGDKIDIVLKLKDNEH